MDIMLLIFRLSLLKLFLYFAANGIAVLLAVNHLFLICDGDIGLDLAGTREQDSWLWRWQALSGELADTREVLLYCKMVTYPLYVSLTLYGLLSTLLY